MEFVGANLRLRSHVEMPSGHGTQASHIPCLNALGSWDLSTSNLVFELLRVMGFEYLSQIPCLNVLRSWGFEINKKQSFQHFC